MEIKNKKQIYNYSQSSKSRMQRFEEPQFGHPWCMSFTRTPEQR